MQSAHPVARALAAAVPHLPEAVWSDVREHPGQGLEARAWDGTAARLGAPAWVDAAAAGVDAADRVWFGDRRGALAAFDLIETPKPDAAAALAELRRRGVDLALLSGDSDERVQALASALGPMQAHAGATPQDKLACIERAQRQGHCVGMVGDGVNDAPVIARADVSFAFAQGAAISQSGADFILMSSAVDAVALTHAVARRAVRVLRQNMGWAIAYNALSIPLALGGLFPPWAAGLGMAGSSLVVVLNALRIDAPRERR